MDKLYNDTNYYKRKHTINISARQNNRLLDLFLSFVWYYSLDGEEWKEIEGLDSKYYISNKGRVLSLCCDGYKLLKPFICGDGYYYVDLRYNNKDVKARVNRLVAKAFVDNPENKPIVHHKDNNKLNNVAENLEFMTIKEHAEEHRKSNRCK